MHRQFFNGAVRLTLSVGTLMAITGCPVAPDTTPDTVPDFSAAAFSDSTEIDNPLYPLVVGTTRIYEANTADGMERVVVTVLSEARTVDGVVCRVVRDTVTLDGVVIEDTLDFFAQDDAGNVWYMGEEVDNYNYVDNGEFLDVTHEGSWEAGKDVSGIGKAALPGYIMKGNPTVGEVYHQEYYEGEAEDMGEIVALNVAVTLADGTTYTCLKTRDFTPLEPALNEYKYHAPGVGVVLVETVGGGERVELVSNEP